MERWLVALIVADLAFVGWILWVFLSFRLRREKGRAEERGRFLERFATSQELSDFLNSGAGERFIKIFGSPPLDPARMLARSIATGVILIFLGAGFLVLASAGVLDDVPFEVPGTLLSMTGIGVLIASAISARLLRRSRNEDRGADLP
jgi:hypothetical protein